MFRVGNAGCMYPGGSNNDPFLSVEYLMKNTAPFFNHLHGQPGPAREPVCSGVVGQTEMMDVKEVTPSLR